MDYNNLVFNKKKVFSLSNKTHRHVFNMDENTKIPLNEINSVTFTLQLKLLLYLMKMKARFLEINGRVMELLKIEHLERIGSCKNTPNLNAL